MNTYKAIANILKTKSDKRFDEFNIEPIKSIKKISEDAYLENPTWVGGDEEFVCLFIDLDNSSKLSFKKHPRTMAKIYDYFTQNIVDVLNQDGMRADYIDIKGDGAFGIFEGNNATFRALVAAITFKTFFDRCIRPKFQTNFDEINCKMAIDKNKVLVKKIGKRGDNNEVWAGRVVNNSSKMAGLTKSIYEFDGDPFVRSDLRCLLVISDKIYNELVLKGDCTIKTCGHDDAGNNSPAAYIWRQYPCENNDSIIGDKVWYTHALWCEKCADVYIQKILN